MFWLLLNPTQNQSEQKRRELSTIESNRFALVMAVVYTLFVGYWILVIATSDIWTDQPPIQQKQKQKTQQEIQLKQ